jgi:hypothetical protein
VIPVLTAFIDGLKPDSLRYMPFLSSLGTRKRVRTELGFSNPCHASMYTGVYPSRHHHWFVWKYAPGESPFGWTRWLPLPENIFVKYGVYRLTRMFASGYRSFYGLPFPWHVPLRLWRYYEVAEKEFWTEPGYVDGYDSIFQLLPRHGLEYETVGIIREHELAVESSKLIRGWQPGEIRPWTYLFFGDIDPLSHRYGQDAPETSARLREIDATLEAKYGLFRERTGDFVFMLFSDHGHVAVTERVDASAVFRAAGLDLRKLVHFMDINYLRFWFRTPDERERVTAVLAGFGERGFILTPEDYKKYHVTMPDNRYGDLIYHLKPGIAFDQGRIRAFGRTWTTVPQTVHGCLPEWPDSDGVFVADRAVDAGTHVTLEDILPSILSLLDVPVPDYVDGRVLWA